MFYKKLSSYPHITKWEIRNILDFIAYEESHGRTCRIECEDKQVLEAIENAMQNPSEYSSVPRPKLITECTACPYRGGCETEFVCHTTSVENAAKIFASGKLLSAVKARGISSKQLMAERRNAAHDPADFFEYIMFAWGNCQAGDRLVMERKLNRLPSEKDLSVGFTPGVRFYFKYDELIKHPKAVIDGFLPLKIKDKLLLSECVYAIIIPKIHQSALEAVIPSNLKSKVIYVKNDCKDIWDWSEKVYCIVEKLAERENR
ncbi:MAG: phosphate ABC transporter ATPase [Clostridia bacterium]|nr:phosphate ABC transporter ATPase [Clostridia bacterium]